MMQTMEIPDWPDDPPERCEQCGRMRHDVRKRLPLPEQPVLCQICFAKGAGWNQSIPT